MHHNGFIYLKISSISQVFVYVQGLNEMSIFDGDYNYFTVTLAISGLSEDGFNMFSRR